MRTPPLLADFIHPGPCKPFCEKSLTLPGQLLRFGFQPLVERFLHTPAHQFLELTPDYFLQNRPEDRFSCTIFLGHGLLFPFDCLCHDCILPEIANPVSLFPLFFLRNLLFLINDSQAIFIPYGSWYGSRPKNASKHRQSWKRPPRYF